LSNTRLASKVGRAQNMQGIFAPSPRNVGAAKLHGADQRRDGAATIKELLFAFVF